MRLPFGLDQLAVDYEWTGTAAAPGIPAGSVQRYRNLLFLTLRDGKMSHAAEYGAAVPQAANE